MYKEEFLSKLMLMFPDKFKNEKSCEEWQEDYLIAISAQYPVNYDKLWDCVRNEWASDKTPSPAWLNERLCRCKKSISLGETKTVEIKYPWIKNMTYITEIPVNWDKSDVIKQNMPKNGWKWSDELNTAVPIVEKS